MTGQYERELANPGHVPGEYQTKESAVNRRTVWLVVVGVLAALSVLFMVGVFAGWWPYQWWEAFR